MGCNFHKWYKGKGRPLGTCNKCWAMWAELCGVTILPTEKAGKWRIKDLESLFLSYELAVRRNERK